MIRSQKVFRVLWTVFAVLFCTVALAQEQSEAPKPVDDVKWVNITGEVESPWNVSADDPSNNGDWKKTPGMVNPKILNNFLNGYLEKLEEFKKTEAEKKKNKL